MHSGGLPDYSAFDRELNSGKMMRTIDLLELVGARKIAPAFSPGSAFAYCNLCYDALALLVENVSRQPYDRFVRNHFLGPAGASRAFLRPARFSDWNGVRIRGYRRTPTGFEANDAFDNEGFYGGSNIYFSALDLARWMAAWANRDPSIRDIEPTATHPVRFPDGQSGLTLGNWYCSKTRSQCYYPGHHQGFHAFGYWDSRRRLAVAFVSNGTLSPMLQSAVPRLLIGAAGGLPPQLQNEPGSKPAEVEPGKYEVSGVGTILISRTGSGLRLRPPGGTIYQLVPIGSGWLYAPGLDVYLSAGPGPGQELLWWSVFAQSSGSLVAQTGGDQRRERSSPAKLQ